MTDATNGNDFGRSRLYYVHGRWFSANLGRFISPNEKGEYLYGSGNDAVDWVWTRAGQFVAGTAYQYAKSNLDSLETLGQVIYPNPQAFRAYELAFQTFEFTSIPDTTAFRVGRVVGGVGAIAQGIAEVPSGFDIAAGGSLASCGTGVLCIAGSAASVTAGSVVIVHGLTTAGISVAETGEQLNLLFAKRFGRSSTQYERHHLLPKQFRDRFEQAGLDIEDFTIDLPFDFHKDIHGRGGGENWINSWNRQWKGFFDDQPNPSTVQILQQLVRMKQEFGIP